MKLLLAALLALGPPAAAGQTPAPPGEATPLPGGAPASSGEATPLPAGAPASSGEATPLPGGAPASSGEATPLPGGAPASSGEATPLPAGAPATGAPEPGLPAPFVESPASAAPASGAAPKRGPTPLEQALEEGYVTRPRDEPAGSLLGGMLALVPGFFVHGLGHFYVGERATAAELLVTEVVAVALVGAGALLGGTTNDSGSVDGARRALFHIGGFLFVGSWLADIVGALKGAESFPPDSSRTSGSVFSLAYRFTSNPLTPFRHHLVGQLSVDTGLIFAVPQVDLEADLAERTYEMDLGVRVFRGRNPHDQVVVGARVRRVESQLGLGSNAIQQFEGYVGWKVELGQFIRSLRNFYLVNRIGVVVPQLLIASGDSETVPGPFAKGTFLPKVLAVESGVELNTGPKTHFVLRYIQDPTRDVAAASSDFGLLEAGIVHSYSDDLDIQFSLVGGDGWAIWLGTGFAL